MLSIIPIKKLRHSLSQQGIRVYLSECGTVRIETDHYRCEMMPEAFLALLRRASNKYLN